ncbi:hypothetical protein [Hydrogenophaga pseudoflava]|uniref:hypothetical protein n=1 Tax=Hydrogenophaga pseudoflava TaxID=47421 RepID=UPI0027E40AA2|nr:hypothetical protein [Hydrogenophaga pseudoflava]MDQ7742747.1 hypothetical protein [Hydrogenophaga pseudoflava]
MKNMLRRFSLVASFAALLAACSSTPPPPDWQMNAKSSAERAAEAWLSGNSKVEEVEFLRARGEVARTAQPALLARLELMRCASRVAALVFEPCTGYEALAPDAAPAEQAYARYLTGQATAADAALLPPAHRALVGATPASLGGIEDPLSRLIAAGVLLRRGVASPAVVADAVETASQRGWRRPLLAWLGVQLRQAQAAGAADEVARIQRRIQLLAP